MKQLDWIMKIHSPEMANSTDSGRAEGRLSLLINSTYGGILLTCILFINISFFGIRAVHG